MKNIKKGSRLENTSNQIKDFKIPKIENPKGIKPEIFNQFSPQIQVQLNEIMKFDQLITEKMKNPKDQEMFINNPREFFEKHKIKVSSFIERKLREFEVKSVIPSEEFIMPNGDRLVPKITIKIKS